MLWFVRPSLRDSEVVRLFLVQFGQLHSQLPQVGLRHLLVQLREGERGRERGRERGGGGGVAVFLECLAVSYKGVQVCRAACRHHFHTPKSLNV